MKLVQDILRAKNASKVWAVKPDDSVYSALTLMAEKDVGAVVVMDGERITGILSERDYARKVVLRGLVSRNTAVRDIMTPDVLVVGLRRTVDECMALMTDKRIRHLPVVDGDRLVGMVSIGDVVKAQIAEREFVIEQLTQYITGRIR